MPHFSPVTPSIRRLIQAGAFQAADLFRQALSKLQTYSGKCFPAADFFTQLFPLLKSEQCLHGRIGIALQADQFIAVFFALTAWHR